jgi:hypothetical protein
MQHMHVSDTESPSLHGESSSILLSPHPQQQQGMSRREQEECIRETRVLSALDCQFITKYYDSFLEKVCGVLGHVQHWESKVLCSNDAKREKHQVDMLMLAF